MSNFVVAPQILTETRYGLSAHTIMDEMFSRREIMCADEINTETVNGLISQILELAHEDPDKDIVLYIDSPGGEVASGLALYDVMQAVPCPIRTVCVGEAASMAAVLFAAGDVREMLPHSYVMIHDPLTMGISGSALDVKSKSELLMKTRQTTCELLAKHTGRTLEEIYGKTGEDCYFYGKEAVEFGLADKVITSIDCNSENSDSEERRGD